MSEYMFGVTREKLTVKEQNRRDRIARRIAKEHGINPRCAGFSQILEPTGQYLGWFTIPNRGEPFDRELAKEINIACGLEN